MTRASSLAAFAIAALLALPACGDEDAPRAAAPKPRVSERPAGTLVYVSRGNRLTAVDVASGRRRVRRMSAVATCGPQLHVLAGRIVFAGVVKTRTTVFSVPVSLDEPPTRLGAAHLFVPSATPGRVWLAGLDCDRALMTGVREVTVDGRVTASSRRRVPGTWVSGAVRAGLVIQRGRSLVVWDPRTGRSGRRLGLAAVIGGHGDLMVGCTAPHCSDLALADAASGRTVVARASRGQRLELSSALSPDGRLLAAPARRHRRWSVALVDTRTGATKLLPGSHPERSYPQLDWAESSGWLFIRGGRGRVLAYRPGAPRAVRLPLRVREAATFAAG